MLVDFHPLTMILDDDWRHRHPYSRGKIVLEEGVGDYVGAAAGG